MEKTASLLNKGGRFVLSISKNQDKTVNYGDREITYYPDDPDNTRMFLAEAGLKITGTFETEFAYIFTSIKE